jgi:hypothetical protein
VADGNFAWPAMDYLAVRVLKIEELNAYFALGWQPYGNMVVYDNGLVTVLMRQKTTMPSSMTLGPFEFPQGPYSVSMDGGIIPDNRAT